MSLSTFCFFLSNFRFLHILTANCFTAKPASTCKCHSWPCVAINDLKFEMVQQIDALVSCLLGLYRFASQNDGTYIVLRKMMKFGGFCHSFINHDTSASRFIGYLVGVVLLLLLLLLGEYRFFCCTLLYGCRLVAAVNRIRVLFIC